MSQTLAIINARLVDPATEFDGPGGVRIENGVIADWGEQVETTDLDTVIDARGRILAPALIDLRTAIEPGFTPDGETASHLAAAAAAGGVGTVVIAPNALTPQDAPGPLKAQAAGLAQQRVRMMLAGGATVALDGKAMAELGLQNQVGLAYYSCGDAPIGDARTFRRILSYASQFDHWVAARPADAHLSADAIAVESDWSARMGLPAEPAIAERMAIERDASLAELSGGKLLVDRVSTRSGLDALRHVRRRDIDIAAMASIAHLVLNEIDAASLDGNLRMTPPLRTEDDRLALIEAVAAGEIQAIVSDHRPTPFDDKGEPFAMAAPGTLAVEILLAALLGRVHDEELSLVEALRPVTSGPADLLGLEQGRLAVGAPADLVLIDGDRPWVCDPENFRSARGNCAWTGRRMTGQALQTLIGGITIHNSEV